jgi:hypothetical protein
VVEFDTKGLILRVFDIKGLILRAFDIKGLIWVFNIKGK